MSGMLGERIQVVYLFAKGQFMLHTQSSCNSCTRVDGERLQRGGALTIRKCEDVSASSSPASKAARERGIGVFVHLATVTACYDRNWKDLEVPYDCMKMD